MTQSDDRGDAQGQPAGRLASLRDEIRLFDDRVDAGRQLAGRLESLHGQDIVVLGLPRGGVPVAFEVAKALQAPLDVLMVRKLGVHFQPELAFAAIGEGDDVRVLNDLVVCQAHLDGDAMDTIEGKQRIELRRRADGAAAEGIATISLKGRIAVIVDDGIATGATAKAACLVVRARGARRVVLAVPIGPDDIVARFAGYADEMVCLQTPAFLYAVGQGYRNFTQTSDDEVIALLDRARDGFREGVASVSAADPLLCDEEVEVTARGDGGRASHDPRARYGDRCVRARQRKQQAQPPQSVRRRGIEQGWARHPAVRPAHSCRGTQPRQRLRHRVVGSPAG